MVNSNGEACDSVGETLWRVASPMEKKQRKVLAVELEDVSTTQVPVSGISWSSGWDRGRTVMKRDPDRIRTQAVVS